MTVKELKQIIEGKNDDMPICVCSDLDLSTYQNIKIVCEVGFSADKEKIREGLIIVTDF